MHDAMIVTCKLYTAHRLHIYYTLGCMGAWRHMSRAERANNSHRRRLDNAGPAFVSSRRFAAAARACMRAGPVRRLLAAAAFHCTWAGAARYSFVSSSLSCEYIGPSGMPPAGGARLTGKHVPGHTDPRSEGAIWLHVSFRLGGAYTAC